MNTKKLAGTDLETSEVGFGGIPIIALSKDEAVSVIRHCYDLGITFYDTANMYQTSEEKIGTALEAVRDSQHCRTTGRRGCDWVSNRSWVDMVAFRSDYEDYSPPCSSFCAINAASTRLRTCSFCRMLVM